MSAIPVDSFYGKQADIKIDISPQKCVFPYKIQNLLSGPTTIWKVFKKQADALNFMLATGSGLMTFAFEHDQSRLFLVAHPDVFWHYDEQRSSHLRCSYEVIPEFSSCKLYFDLEFDKSINLKKNVDCMMEVFLKTLFHLIQLKFNIKCTTDDVLILDSTTSAKFSQHIIFNHPEVHFINNINAGSFVKYICNVVLKSIEDDQLLDDIKLANISLEELKILIVLDSKGKSKLFCDESVYSRNRHFRLFKSTKKGKNSPLLVKYKCSGSVNDKDVFFSSLISYFDVTESTRVLEFFTELEHDDIKLKGTVAECSRSSIVSASPFPDLDAYISTLVVPGRIFRSLYFQSTNRIVYDTVGFRYCHNIGRRHKSNNVKLIVDLNHWELYQKCYDPDCALYRSEGKPLPDNLRPIQQNLDTTSTLGIFEDPQVAEKLDHSQNGTFQPTNLKQFPSFGLSDEAFLDI